MTDFGGKTSIFSHPVYLFLRKFSLQDSRGGSGNNTNKWYYGNADTTFEPLNHLPDYCNDPSTSWPIIEKYRISILDQLTEWCVDAKGVSPIFDTRPLRAAMIVFLLMQEANNA
ncbi:phage protein NinX family protein [Escherichia albertii]|uniref:phage protein NinX family protein n=1 Tax=Escherichia albertii TaxID=208962 RepID=UPI0021D43F35|nr:phage protein NinX family protein [Escherichia albertii]MCU7334061.1 DUF2591 family protein [Escherichia albertii]